MIRLRVNTLLKGYHRYCLKDKVGRQCVWSYQLCSTASSELSEKVDAEVASSRKPRTNIPFAKDIFLGKFDKVSLFLLEFSYCTVVVVDQFTPGYQFRPTLNFLEDL